MPSVTDKIPGRERELLRYARLYLAFSPIVLVIALGFKSFVFEWQDPNVRHVEGNILQCTKQDLGRGTFHITLTLADGSSYGFTEPQEFVSGVEKACGRRDRFRIGYVQNKRRSSQTPDNWMVSLFNLSRGVKVLSEADGAAWNERNDGYKKIALIAGILLFAGSGFVVLRAKRLAKR